MDKQEPSVRFLFPVDVGAATFIYRPPNSGPPLAQDATIGFKFAQGTVILDDYWLIGGTKWSRFIYRMKNHPWVATKRAFKIVYRKIRRWFKGDEIKWRKANLQ